MSVLTGAPLVAAALVAVSAVLVAPPAVRAAAAPGRLAGGAATPVYLALPALPWTAGLLAGLLAWRLGAGLVGAVALTLVLGAWARGRRRARAVRDVQAREARAFEACGVLVDELRSGRPSHLALAAAGEVDPVLGPVIATATAGGDVPAALRACGLPSYRWVASAWQVAEAHGSGLDQALRRVMTQVRAEARTSRTVASELASARATAKLLAGLPLFALVAGTASGGDPWHFLLQTPFGSGCLVLGLFLGWLGLRWIEAIAHSVQAQR